MSELSSHFKRIAMTSGIQAVAAIETFAGGADYDMFIDAVLDVADRNEWTEDQVVRTIASKFRDRAREYYRALTPIERPQTVIEMRSWLKKIFGEKVTIEAGKQELAKCVRRVGETLGEYVHRLKIVANKAFPYDPDAPLRKIYKRDQMLVEYFKKGIEHRIVNEMARAGDLETIDEALDIAQECERVVTRYVDETSYDRMHVIVRKTDAIPANPTQPQNSPAPYSEMNNANGAYASRALGQYNRPRYGERWRQTQGYGRRGGYQNQNIGTAEHLQYEYMRDRCYRCGDDSHRAIGCRRVRRVFCYACGSAEHTAAQCHLNSRIASTQPPR